MTQLRFAVWVARESQADRNLPRAHPPPGLGCPPLYRRATRARVARPRVTGGAAGVSVLCAAWGAAEEQTITSSIQLRPTEGWHPNLARSVILRRKAATKSNGSNHDFVPSPWDTFSTYRSNHCLSVLHEYQAGHLLSSSSSSSFQLRVRQTRWRANFRTLPFCVLSTGLSTWKSFQNSVRPFRQNFLLIPVLRIPYLRSRTGKELRLSSFFTRSPCVS